MVGIEELLYHRPPMIFLDEVVEADASSLTARVHVRPGIPFFEEGFGVPAWVGLEYMAQAVAALAGLRAREQDKPISLGMLIGCRRYTSDVSVFSPGTHVRVSVHELASGETGLGSFDCSLSAPDPVAEGRIAVYDGRGGLPA